MRRLSVICLLCLPGFAGQASAQPVERGAGDPLAALPADSYFNIPLERRARYLGWFREAGVSHVFAGHYHRNAGGFDGALEMVTTGPVGRPLGDDPSGFRIVRVAAQGIGHEYLSLGALPNRLPGSGP